MVPTSTSGRTVIAVLMLVVLLAWGLVPGGASAHPGHGEQQQEFGIGVVVNSPQDLAGFLPAALWAGAARPMDETAELVYLGTGCTPVPHLIEDVEGKIALIDDMTLDAQPDSPFFPTDICPAATFFQKAQFAEQAGAIGLVQVRRDDGTSGRNAITSSIPVLELSRTNGQAIIDAVRDEHTVNVTLADLPTAPTERLSNVACEGGMAGPFPCDGVDLLGFVPHAEFDSDGISDIWGWTDPADGDEYVILGKTNGIAFFRVTDPTDAVYLGELPNPALLQAVWHDIKVYANHAFTVSESEQHGMTVFDLTRLRGVDQAQVWDIDAHYRLNANAHNVAINEDTGFAYIVGGNAGILLPDQCLSGLHMVDISDPTDPTFAGCYLEEGGPGTAARSVGPPVTAVSPAAYVHDTQCVLYEGPDQRHAGQEICFNAAETQIVIADVTDKLRPTTLGTLVYDNVGYAHQGWLTEDHRFLIVNDELDEVNAIDPETGDPGMNTRTIVLDVSDLENPTVHFEHMHDTVSSDHNLYVHDGLVYMSNYASGLRVFDTAFIGDPDDARLEPVGFFDTFPPHSNPGFDGTWSNYPFFESGTIAVSGRQEGLFLLRLRADEPPDGELGVHISTTRQPVRIPAGEAGTVPVTVRNTGDVADTYELMVTDLPDGWTATVDPAELTVAADEDGTATVTIEVPADARPGRSTLTITATSTADPSVAASADVAVVVTGGPPGAAQRGGAPAPHSPGAADGEPTGAELRGEAVARPGRDQPLPAALAALALLALSLGPAVRRRLTG